MKFFKVSKVAIFHAFTQKIEFFSLFVFGQKRTRNKV